MFIHGLHEWSPKTNKQSTGTIYAEDNSLSHKSYDIFQQPEALNIDFEITNIMFSQAKGAVLKVILQIQDDIINNTQSIKYANWKLGQH